MLVATVLFLRNLRLTRLGAMVNSIVACLKEFFWWCMVALMFVIPFAVLQFNMFFPNSLVKSIDEQLTDKCPGKFVHSGTKIRDVCSKVANEKMPLILVPDCIKRAFPKHTKIFQMAYVKNLVACTINPTF